MTSTSLKYASRGVLLMVPLALLSACGPSQQEMVARDKLDRAQIAYSDAKANPAVSSNAPVALLEAGRQLKAAESSSDYKEMEQHTYLAERKTQTALAIAEKKVAENEIERLSKESSAVLLAKRGRELEASQGQTADKAREVEALRLETAKRAEELEMARHKASAMAGENEQARQLAEQKVSEAEQARQLAEANERAAEQARLLAETKAEEARKLAEAKDLASAQIIKELAELKAKQTERGIVLTVGDVLFETGRANLSPRAERSATKLADFLKNNPSRNILIEGHTDSVGSNSNNLTLSKRRADSVRQLLMAKGVSPERITTNGYGEMYPVSSNDTNIGRQHNRRVEVIILNEGVQPESVVR